MNSHSSVRSFFMVMLLLLFGASVLLCLIFEISGYEKTVSLSENSSKEHLPFAYLSQKLRSAENIETEDNMLILENGNAVTYIYFYEDHLYELTALKDYRFEKEDGEKLFEIDDLRIRKESEQILISYQTDGKEKNVVFSLRRDIDENG